jgi:hypothetical protein
MKNERSPTTYLTIEELTQIAAEKFEQTAAVAPSHQKEELLRSAENFRNHAETKGWLPSELKPPSKPMSEEGEYRAFVVRPDGHFLRSHEFYAVNDDAAFEHARQFVNYYDVELWSGARMVGKLESTK